MQTKKAEKQRASIIMGKVIKIDVFLSHNSKDKPAVRKLANRLKKHGLKVWLDEWELRPGQPWQEAIEEILECTQSAIVAVGKDGLGPWQDREMIGCLSEFVRRNIPVIPVLLADCPTVPRLPFFLNQFTWVDLRANDEQEDNFLKLLWGITGQKPSGLHEPTMQIVEEEKAHILDNNNNPVIKWRKGVLAILVTCLLLFFGYQPLKEKVIQTRNSIPERSVALVIGNSHYKELGILKNPINDAVAVADRLKKSGFEILRPILASQDVQEDLDSYQMLKARDALEMESANAQMVVLYYAGHGLQVDGNPYLVPIDALPVTSLTDPRVLALFVKHLTGLDKFIEHLNNSKLTISIFDACRDIPTLGGKSRGIIMSEGSKELPWLNDYKPPQKINTVLRGGSRLTPKSQVKNRILAFSVGFGELSTDGAGQHSPYTQALIDQFDQGGKQDVIDFFRGVQSRMLSSTGQTPELLIQGNVPTHEFFFNGDNH